MGRALLCIPADDDSRCAVRAALERSGLAIVSEVARGVDALAAAVEHKADIVVLDLSLVGTLGLRLISLLRTVAPGIVVVALSPFDTLVPAALDAGAAAALTSAELPRLPRLLAELDLSA
jgi:DNA-binding NarL/FixJ family response regulator